MCSDLDDQIRRRFEMIEARARTLEYSDGYTRLNESRAIERIAELELELEVFRCAFLALVEAIEEP